jgi:hypothetical protein
MTYDKQIQNKWLTPREEGFKLACCDCGLVHDVNFRVKDGRAQINFIRRNKSETTRIRKTHRIHSEIVNKVKETLNGTKEESREYSFQLGKAYPQ